jgi:peptide/nickel transport system ATP-binding protein
MSLLTLHRVSTRLQADEGWVHALDELSLSIAAGQTFALVGESGCGKSMTALSIARLLPDSGAVVGGRVHLAKAAASGNAKVDHAEDLLQLPERLMRAVRGKRVSMIFQEPGSSLNPVMTVGEQLTEVIQTHHPVSSSEARAQALHWLQQVGLDNGEARLLQYPFQLSGGQKQRVMIAIALAAKPDLLIADEPTTALDVSIQAQVLALLQRLQRKQGMAMLLITHDLGIVSQMADHVALMYAGQIVETAPARQFFAHPRHPYARALLDALPDSAVRGSTLKALAGQVPSLVNPPAACRFASRCEQAQADCTERMPQLEPVATGHEVRCWFPIRVAPVKGADIGKGTASAAPADSLQKDLLVVKGLTVAYKASGGLFKRNNVPVVQGVDFALQRGKTLAVVGESGSGKSTLAKAVLQLLTDTAQVGGSAVLSGHELMDCRGEALRLQRRRMQVVFQDPFASLNPRQRVQDILLEGLSQLCPDLGQDAALQKIGLALNEVGLPATALLRFPHEFSGGQRQRIAIARALVVEPDLLILDEPTSALDVSVQAQVLNLLRGLQQKTGMGFLLITHNLAVVEYMADDVIVLKRGVVVEAGPVLDVMHRPSTDYTRELIAALPRVS